MDKHTIMLIEPENVTPHHHHIANKFRPSYQDLHSFFPPKLTIIPFIANQ